MLTVSAFVAPGGTEQIQLQEWEYRVLEYGNTGVMELRGWRWEAQNSNTPLLQFLHQPLIFISATMISLFGLPFQMIFRAKP